MLNFDGNDYTSLRFSKNDSGGSKYINIYTCWWFWAILAGLTIGIVALALWFVFYG
jgi:hypothetical protein